MKTKALRLLPLMLLLGLGQVMARPVDLQTAREVGARFMNANTRTPLRGAEDLQLVTTYSITRGDAAFYVFNTPNGFVIVSADDCATPILGYSDEGLPFDPDNVPIQLQDYLQGFVEQIQYGIENHVQDEITTQQWELMRSTGILNNNCEDKSLEDKMLELLKAKNYSTIEKGKEPKVTLPTFPKNRSNRSVEPLITAQWDQGCYYNAMCPEDENGTCNHVPTGCVATAMGMIMRYWGYPAQGIGSHSYTPDGYPEQTVNFGETTYGWDNMPDQLTETSTQEEIDVVSTLLWHCGVAVEMSYSTYSSSAMDDPIPVAFHDHFGYCTPYYQWNDDNSTWIEQVKNSIDRQRPLLYFATDEAGLGGHAFICDGYNAEDQLHFNWGWGGNGNGYFAVDALNVNEFQFNNDIHALFEIMPPSEFQLQYNIIEGGVEVTYERPDIYNYRSIPDTVIIPSTVEIEGIAYPVVAIGDNAFNCAINLKYISIPNTVTSIGGSAFNSCYNMTNLKMSDFVTTIGDAAFIGSGLTSVHFLPNTLVSIGDWAFSWCDGLTAITIPRSTTSVGNALCLLSPVDTVLWNADSCVYDTEGQGVWDCFDECSIVNFGEHVKYIPHSIFSRSNITSVTIPDSVTLIDWSTFQQCLNLRTVYFNAKHCQGAFGPFMECNLETIVFGTGVPNIPSYCLGWCNVESIDLPNSVTNIGGYAFTGCGLDSISLPNSVVNIEHEAFRYCGLSSISIGDSIESIGYMAFYECTNLVSVYMSSITPPSLGPLTFGENAEGLKIIIPCEVYDAYYHGEGWYDLMAYNEGFSLYDYRTLLKTVPETEIQLTALSSDTTRGFVEIYRNASVCDSTTVYFAHANFGYRFDHWNNGSITNPDTLLLTQDTTVIAYFVKDRFNVTGIAGKPILHSDFEQPQFDTLWTLKNEEYTNRWYIEGIENGNRALFVSNDDGQSNNYGIDDSYVMAYSTVALDSGQYIYSYDCRVDGNGIIGQPGLNIVQNDCLYTFIESIDIENVPFVDYGYEGDVLWINALYWEELFDKHDWQRYTTNIDILSDGNYCILFYWRNGNNEPNGHPAAVDNVLLGALDTIRGYVIGAENVDYLDTATITAIPNPGYRFVCWYDCDTNITKDVVVTGDLNCVAYFEPDDTQTTQTANLAQGWNWWAPMVQAPMADIEDALGNNLEAIKASGETLGDNTVLGEMYRIQTTAPCNLTLNGLRPALVAVTIANGYNWFGYTGMQPLAIENLSITPAEGDKVISQDEGFAVYNGSTWEGTLTTLQPGHGYVYFSTAEETKTIVFE